MVCSSETSIAGLLFEMIAFIRFAKALNEGVGLSFNTFSKQSSQSGL